MAVQILAQSLDMRLKDSINHLSKNTARLDGGGHTWAEMKKTVRILGLYMQEMGQNCYLAVDMYCPWRKGKDNSSGDSKALKAIVANIGPEGEGPESLLERVVLPPKVQRKGPPLKTQWEYRQDI